jgi:hypothetical protein
LNNIITNTGWRCGRRASLGVVNRALNNIITNMGWRCGRRAGFGSER